MIQFSRPWDGVSGRVWRPVYQATRLVYRTLNDIRLKVAPVGTRCQVELIFGRATLLLAGGVILVRVGSEIFFQKRLTYQPG